MLRFVKQLFTRPLSSREKWFALTGLAVVLASLGGFLFARYDQEKMLAAKADEYERRKAVMEWKREYTAEYAAGRRPSEELLLRGLELGRRYPEYLHAERIEKELEWYRYSQQQVRLQKEREEAWQRGNIGEGVAQTPRPGKIVFVSTRDRNSEIYVMNADGSGLTNLTNNHAWDGEPALSPDGRKVAFVSQRDGNAEIYLVNIDGSDLSRLTRSTLADHRPIFSPDGRRIAFESARAGNDLALYSLYVINVDGTGLTHLTTDDNEGSPRAAFSPDSRKVVFGSGRDGTSNIYVINVDGTGLTRLTNTPGHDDSPRFSPDGRQIVFRYQHPNTGKTDIYVTNADGSGSTNLTNSTENECCPVFSPDGRKITFVRDGIYLMNADGTGPTRLTNNKEGGRHPVFSPDSRWIAFESVDHERPLSANWEIYVINVDGTGLTNLTRHPATDSAPDWR